jgi:hypothetical protein
MGRISDITMHETVDASHSKNEVAAFNLPNNKSTERRPICTVFVDIKPNGRSGLSFEWTDGALPMPNNLGGIFTEGSALHEIAEFFTDQAGIKITAAKSKMKGKA